MTALQWALLILSVAIVLAVVVISRRERPQRSSRRSSRSSSGSRRASAPPPPPAPVEQDEVREQLDIFDPPRSEPVDEELEPDDEVVSAPRPSAAPPRRAPEPVDELPPEPIPVASPLASPQYDEYGVGRPRRRVMPSLESELSPPGATEPAANPDAPIAPWLKTSAPATPVVPPPPAPVVPPPAASRPAAPRIEPKPGPRLEPKPATPAAAAVPQKIVSLLLVERDGGAIAGTKLHPALNAQGLQFGDKQIYHRLARNEAVFSVASLVKPGVLLPEAADQFSTRGLQVFMVLPGPVKPLTALHDMLATTQSLARALNADVFDGSKQPLSSEAMRALQADVEEWAKTAGL
ncbi:cell division protein ZipA C-terminal FtsZ-binding domain-containing protein [Hydrocarboniphaga effusa]|uniref:cell division protein ZipA C-terminal FtsZ-binding domain-containing protein n=1 Tax=Hydrocarboniphaga effusa TaxID=243629 RepID=UPI003BAD2A9D